MRAIFACILLLQGLPSWAVNTSAEDSLVKNTHLSCKLSRDMRRRDVDQSKSAFQFYLDNKASLLAINDDYLVEGLTAAKVKSFCSRIEGDFQRQDALLIYDKAIGACQASHVSLDAGEIKQAKQHYVKFKSFLELATSTSSEAVDLGRGSLQWRKCQSLEQDLQEFTSGKVKKLRDRLDKAYARCLPVWSEMSTQGHSSLSLQQFTAQLAQMKADSSALQPGIKKLKTAALNAAAQEFQTCINQVEEALPAQFTHHRLSALAQQLQLCRSQQMPEDFPSTVADLLAAQPDNSFSLTEAQAQDIAAQEQALSACVNGESELLAPPIDPLQLDFEIDQGVEEDVVQQLLQEDDVIVPASHSAVQPAPQPVKPSGEAANEHWKTLREEPIQLGR